jgi:hypothetical protein
MITALDQAPDRIAGLEAGADDFLTKPVSDIALITRVKSLVRLKTLTDELMMRAATSSEIGLDEAMDAASLAGEGGRILLVEDQPATVEKISRRKRCSGLPRATTTLPSSASGSSASTASDSARSSVRSTAPGCCRSSSLSARTTIRGCCAASTSGSTTICSVRSMPTR